MRKTYYCYDLLDNRVWLDSDTLDEAIENASELDHAEFGQTVDIYDGTVFGDEVVASSVDVLGFYPIKGVAS